MIVLLNSKIVRHQLGVRVKPNAEQTSISPTGGYQLFCEIHHTPPRLASTSDKVIISVLWVSVKLSALIRLISLISVLIITGTNILSDIGG